MGSQGAGHTIDGVVVPFLWAIDIGSRKYSLNGIDVPGVEDSIVGVLVDGCYGPSGGCRVDARDF